jgi:hypothetical protein
MGTKISLYLIDLAFSRDWRTKQPNERFEGTMYFASVNSIRGRGKLLFLNVTALVTNQFLDQSRRDDLESLAYVLVHLLCQDLPWRPLVAAFNQWTTAAIVITPEEIARCKEETRAEDLCYNLPPLFARFLNHARALEFDEEPHYDRFKQEFSQLAKEVYEEREASNG